MILLRNLSYQPQFPAGLTLSNSFHMWQATFCWPSSPLHMIYTSKLMFTLFVGLFLMVLGIEGGLSVRWANDPQPCLYFLFCDKISPRCTGWTELWGPPVSASQVSEIRAFAGRPAELMSRNRKFAGWETNRVTEPRCDGTARPCPCL